MARVVERPDEPRHGLNCNLARRHREVNEARVLRLRARRHADAVQLVREERDLVAPPLLRYGATDGLLAAVIERRHLRLRGDGLVLVVVQHVLVGRRDVVAVHVHDEAPCLVAERRRDGKERGEHQERKRQERKRS